MAAAVSERPVQSPHITLFGFQEGPSGFVRYGTSPRPVLSEWLDYLYLEAHGGRGSGKSKGGAYRDLHYMLTWPRSLGTIAAPTFSMLQAATLPALFDVFDQVGLVPNQHYEYNKTENRITLFNGSTALLRTTEHAENIRGQDACWFHLDEGRNSPREAFLNLQATLRKPGFPHQGWVTTSPVGKGHWTYTDFHPELGDNPPEVGVPYVDDSGDTVTFWVDILPNGRICRRFHIQPADGSPEQNIRYVAYPAKTRENPHGGLAHYRQLVQTFGEGSLLARQELDGEFVLMEGLVYPAWNPERMVQPESAWPSTPVKIACGIDFGFVAPAAAVVMGIDGDGRRYVMDELYGAGMTQEDLKRGLWNLKRKHGISYFFADSADPRWISFLKGPTHGGPLPVLRAKKKVGSAADISSGIGLCTWEMVRTMTDGSPPFLVHPRCTNFIREIENYVLDEGRDGVNPPERGKKLNDHAMDARRYCSMGIARFWDRPPSSGRSIRTAVRSH